MRIHKLDCKEAKLIVKFKFKKTYVSSRKVMLVIQISGMFIVEALYKILQGAFSLAS